jgi:hypothetical protein
LDDVYWPLAIAMTGRRVVHDERARAFDRHPEHTSDEFRRKVRTLAGNFQLMARLPSSLAPWQNHVWWQFVSHRALRLVVPWALAAMLVSTLAAGGLYYRIAFGCQLAFYAVALAGIRWPSRKHSRLVSVASSFLVLNAAAFAGFWIWAAGASRRSWGKVNYGRVQPVSPLD